MKVHTAEKKENFIFDIKNLFEGIHRFAHTFRGELQLKSGVFLWHNSVNSLNWNIAKWRRWAWLSADFIHFQTVI